MSILVQLVLLLATAVLAILVARRLRLSAILGYLAAGLLLGPQVTACSKMSTPSSISASWGVVMFLFLIGIELQPSRLWVMRRAILGLGTAQMVLCSAGFAAAAMAFGATPAEALIIGLGLSLSSTAFALQLLSERGELTTRHGRSAFAVLLFQDLAAVPLIGILPLIAARADSVPIETALISIAEVALVIVTVILIGRYALRHVFRFVADTEVREAFTALALLTVVGTALVMEVSGLSAAFGAFIAGVLLADSEYRHQIEADIDPFRGLLLGVFFIAVGMSVEIGGLIENPALVIGFIIALIAFKFAVIFGLARLGGLTAEPAARAAASICQGGEFAFVIFGIAGRNGIIDAGVADFLILVVIGSMAATPLILALQERLFRSSAAPQPPTDEPLPTYEGHVIIAGFGRYGQIAGRILQAKRIPFTALEKSTSRIGFVRRYGNKIYYGDTAQPQLLRAAGADRAAAFVLAIDDADGSIATARTVRRYFPRLPIFARARNRLHARTLMELGVTHVQRETFLSSLDTARHLLMGLGMPTLDAERIVEAFRDHDVRRLREDVERQRDEHQMAATAQAWAEELEAQFASDEAERAKDRESERTG